MDRLLLELPTLEDLELVKKKVFMRIDINCPIDYETGKILDDRRIRVHSAYIKSIVEKYEPALVLGSHQGRPGEREFVSLEEHAELLSKYTGISIRFVDDVIGPAARQAIKDLKPGEVLLLDNLRFVSEEVIEADPEIQSNTILVKKLSNLFDYYVNDAFATAHRSQPSIVGFPLVLPSAIGPLFEKEVKAVSKIYTSGDGPRVFVLGGSKIHDLIRVIENLVRNKLAERILTTGVLAQLFLLAKGVKIGDENIRILEEKNALTLIPRARQLLLKGAPIETPVDVKTLVGEKEVDNTSVTNIRGVIKDIGDTTIEVYSEFIKEASLVVMRGPAGVIEDERFREGTLRLLDAVSKTRAFVIIAGGHLGSMVDDSRIDSSRIHVSTGGNALLLMLSGEELPAIKAMLLSKSIFHGGKK
ncbi:phosphoglycerate kinase [Thermogladius sp. 4427co]|uniref:phosphoglycerate kinase n=1 Tax=Thermogladius sp. 4427co TaxID=3450718 RepID=UPI003F79651C